jgi:hypothetical protein
LIATILVGILSTSSIALADHNPRVIPHRGEWRPVGETGVVFSAPGLTHEEARGLRKPVILDSAALLRDIRSLERRIVRLRQASDGASTSLRADLCHIITGLEVDVERLRRKVRTADRATLRADEHSHVVVVHGPDEELIEAADPRAFASIVQSIRSTPFSQDRLWTLRSIARDQYFTTEQVKGLARLFVFSRERVDALAALYPRTVDPENFHETYRLLIFSSDRRKLMKRIGTI